MFVALIGGMIADSGCPDWVGIRCMTVMREKQREESREVV